MSQHRSTTAKSSVDAEDYELLLAMVRELSIRDIAALVERPETPASPKQCQAALQQLGELGVLSSKADRGYGLWDSPTHSDSVSLSVAILRELAHVSPSIAYLAHVRGLSNWLDFSSGVDDGESTFSADRTSPSGGRIMGASLAGFQLNETEDQALHAAWGPLSAETQVLILDVEDSIAVWRPQWTGPTGWRVLRSAGDRQAQPSLTMHGLDELTAQLLGGPMIGNPLADEGTEAEIHLSQDYAINALSTYSLGLLSIALGAAERALAQARQYARERTQGSLPIAHYDAVAELLQHGEQAIEVAEAAVSALAMVDDPLNQLQRVWRTRATVHPLLTAAGSDSLQVFGGIGYMRDMGAEKVLRDLNMLRRLGGSPQDLTLRCAGFDQDGWAAHA